jgi:adenylate kinase
MIGMIFMGLPCSGKSTIAKGVSRELDFTYISSGDIARRMASGNDDIKRILDNGQMAPEVLMRGEIAKSILRCKHDNKSFVLDGFPRFLGQYEWLISVFPEIKFMCVYVQASINTIYNRHSIRGRDDDSNEVFTQRVRYFNVDTLPLISMMGTVCRIDNDCDTDMDSIDANIYNRIRSWIYANDCEI